MCVSKLCYVSLTGIFQLLHWFSSRFMTRVLLLTITCLWWLVVEQMFSYILANSFYLLQHTKTLKVLQLFRKPRQRNYAFERSKCRSGISKTTSHPLGHIIKTSTKTVSQSKKSAKSSSATASTLRGPLDGFDPLSMLTASNDPLSVLAIGTLESSSTSTKVRITFPHYSG